VRDLFEQAKSLNREEINQLLTQSSQSKAAVV
jgi:hypothetical protein